MKVLDDFFPRFISIVCVGIKKVILSLQRIRMAFWFYIEWIWANFKKLAFSVVQHGKSDYFDMYCANQMRNADLFDNIVWSHGLTECGICILDMVHAFAYNVHVFRFFLLCKVRMYELMVLREDTRGV